MTGYLHCHRTLLRCANGYPSPNAMQVNKLLNKMSAYREQDKLESDHRAVLCEGEVPAGQRLELTLTLDKPK